MIIDKFNKNSDINYTFNLYANILNDSQKMEILYYDTCWRMYYDIFLMKLATREWLKLIMILYDYSLNNIKYKLLHLQWLKLNFEKWSGSY